MRKRIISLLLVFCMVFSLVPTTAFAVTDKHETSAELTNPFQDIKESDWFYDSVQYARVNGFFSGTSATTFDPNGTMTRGMFVTVLARMAGVDAERYRGETSFDDVSADDYYAPYVAWAVKYGITAGTGDDKFSPDVLINRAQMATLFVRYFEAFDISYETGANITTVPADLDSVPDYAKDAVMKLWRQGLLVGDGVNFNPDGNATRAQAATLAARMDEVVETWYKEPGVESERVKIDPATGEAINSGTAVTPTPPSDNDYSPSRPGTIHYAVRFQMGAGQTEITLPTEQTVTAGTAISSLPTPAKAGVIFLGWYYDENLTQGVESDDTVTRNMTLYAKTAAGEEVQSVETPNYVTRTDINKGNYSFSVIGLTGDESIKAAIKFINITGGNMDVAYSISNGTVTATLEAGQTYQVELLNDAARFKLGNDEQSASVRYLNLLTAKDEVKNAKLNSGVIQIPLNETTGLNNTVFAGLYQIDEQSRSSANTTSGDFTYSGNKSLQVGDVLAVTSGNVDLENISSTAGEVGYIKITAAKTNNVYSYEMADVNDVLFIPDVLPIQTGWYTDNSESTVTISSTNLATAMNNVSAESLDVGDFIGFISTAYSDGGTASSYGQITAFTQQGDQYVITYSAATEATIESALDVYYTQEQTVELTAGEEAAIKNEIQQDVVQSGYAEQASLYLAAVMLASDGLEELPDEMQVSNMMRTMSAVPMSAAPVAAASTRGGGVMAASEENRVNVEFDPTQINVRVQANAQLDHLQGKGFNVEINIPFTVTINDTVEIAITATFEEEIIQKQNVSTKRHKIGFLKYDYSLNASFDVGNYTGIGFTAEISAGGDEESESMTEKLDAIMERMESYHESGGVQGTNGEMESLAEIYSDVMDNANDSWFDVVNVKLFETNGSAFLHIFCYQVKGSFVVSANLAVSMGMNFEYMTQKRYNFSVRVKAKTSTNETIDIITPQYNFDFYVVGTVGIRAGLRLEMYVGLISLKLDKIGIVAETGAYTQLWGYFFYHMRWVQGQGKSETSAGAMLIEIGMYLDIKFVAQAFNSSKLTWAPTIYSNQWPMWSAGQQQNVYAFAAPDDESYTFKTVKTLSIPGSTFDMQYMDLKSGETDTVNRDDKTESAFVISFSNPNYSYNAERNLVTVTPAAGSLSEETEMVITWKKAPLSFTSQPIQKVLYLAWSDPEGVRYISFDTMGGSAVPQITGGSGASITWPEAPTKQGYTFNGWYTNQDCSTAYSGSTAVMPTFSGGTKGMTLYAKWTPAQVNYTVEHYLEALDGSYELNSTETKRGTTGTATTDSAKSYTGFAAKAFDEQTIAADGSTTVQVYYNRNKYTVTWDLNDGMRQNTQICKYGAKLVAPKPVRDGYTFAGWNVTTLPETVTENVTYTAQWTGNDNEVLFNTMGGSTITAVTVKTGEKIMKPAADPSRTGYTFGGWYADQTCTRIWNFEDAVSGPMTLFAKWTANPYTVSFDANGGTVNESSKSVTYDSAYSELPTPTRQGYAFAGWFTSASGGDKVTAETVVSTANDHTLYAHWTEGAARYTVKHLWQNIEDGGYTQHESEEKSGTTSQQTAAEAKCYPGFTAQPVTQAEIKADGSTIIEIKYDRTTHTVTWKNGSDVLSTDTGVKYGAKPAYSGNQPTKTATGHTFVFIGWNTAENGSGTAWSETATVTGDVTYYAQFSDSADTYQITYENVSGATNGNPANYTYGTAVTLQAPSKIGHSFDGWYGNSGCTGTPVTVISATETGNKTFYAKWTPIKYTVNWDANGGTLSGSYTSGAVDYGTTITEPTPTREGYTFTGWTPTVPAAVPAENISFTAQWKINSHTLSWNPNGGTLSGSYTDGTVQYGTTITAPTATRTGYTFNGWNPSVPGTMPDSNQSFTAQWTAVQYNVTFNANDGSVTQSNKQVAFDSTYGDLPTPTRQGYTFTGWYTAKEGGSKVESSTYVTNANNHTLFAHWIEYAVQYDLWIGGVQVTGGCASNVFGDGKVSYNPETNTLTLNNYSYEGPGTRVTGIAAASCILYNGENDLIINLKGNNSLTFNGEDYYTSGIFINQSNLTIGGTGSLTVSITGATTDNDYLRSFCICVADSNKTLTVNGGTINATGGNISATNVEDNTDGISIGLYAKNLVVNGGSVTATGGNVSMTTEGTNTANPRSYGISGKLTVNGGSVTAYCGSITNNGTEQNGYAMYDKPVSLAEGVTAHVSRMKDGSSESPYDSSVALDTFRTYQWFRAEKSN